MNKYEIQGIIDEGAYGIVLKATVKGSQEVVAIKKFKETDEDPVVKGPIQREIRMLKALKSDHVVELKEAFRRKGKVYLVFEYMENNLLQVIEQHSHGLPSDEVTGLILQIVKCLAFMHSKGIIHRDLKPENLLISRDMRLKLCDFGFTRSLPQANEELTDYVATRWYRSPELLVGEPYSKPLDMWSLGCIMFQVITGLPLFPGENQIDQLHLIRKSLGELTIEQTERIKNNSRFAGVKFPQIRRLDTIESKLEGKTSKYAIAFIKQCLKMDPNQRITAAAALNHSYFNSSRTKSSKYQQSVTEHSENTSPPKQQSGLTADKMKSRIKTIYNSKSNDNVWRIAGATRVDKKFTFNRRMPQPTIFDRNKRQFQNTVTQLCVNSHSPDQMGYPSKEFINPKNKRSLNNPNVGSSIAMDSQTQRTKVVRRIDHERIRSLKQPTMRTLNQTKINRFIGNNMFESEQISFEVTGDAKSFLRKL